MNYKGFGIDYNIYGLNEYSVQDENGDDFIFETVDEAKAFIDEISK